MQGVLASVCDIYLAGLVRSETHAPQVAFQQATLGYSTEQATWTSITVAGLYRQHVMSQIEPSAE